MQGESGRATRREFLRVTGASIAALALAGCGAQATAVPTATVKPVPVAAEATKAPAPTAVPATAKPIELNWWFGSWGGPTAEKVSARYQETHPNVKFKFELIPFDGYLDKVLTALMGGQKIDIVEITPQWLVSLTSQNVLRTLTDRQSDADVKKDDFFPDAWTSSTWKGDLYGLPYRWETWAMVYNSKMFTAAGLDPDKPPKTWDTFVDYAKKLTTADVYGFGLGAKNTGNTIIQLTNIIRTNGGDVLDAEYKKATCNSPAAVQAIQWDADLYLKNKVVQKSIMTDDTNDVEKLFGAGKVAMHWIGLSTLAYMSGSAPTVEFKTCSLPGVTADKPGMSTATGWIMTVPKSAQDVASSWDFIKYFTSTDIAAEFARTTPARKSSSANTLFTATRPMDKYKPYIDGMGWARIEPPIAQWSSIGPTLCVPGKTC